MNCDEFKRTVTDFARGQINVDLRETAEQHASACRACAALLQEQLSVTASLHALASADMVEEAPLRVEAALVSEIRAHQKPVRLPAWRVFAAAGALLAIALLGGRLVIHPNATSQPSASKPAIRPVSPNPACCPQRAIVHLPEEHGSSTPKPSSTRQASTGTRPARSHGQGSLAQIANNSRQSRNRESERAADAGIELATEFIPVPYGNTLDPITGGQILRIRLPRSALNAVGLPMSQENSRMQVDADVLMDQNMTVRAIRFLP